MCCLIAFWRYQVTRSSLSIGCQAACLADLEEIIASVTVYISFSIPMHDQGPINFHSSLYPLSFNFKAVRAAHQTRYVNQHVCDPGWMLSPLH